MNQFQLAQSGLEININKVDFWILVILLLILVGYSIYAFIVMKQVRILNNSVRTDNAPLLDGLALLHLFGSLVLLGIVILLLLF